MTCHSGKQQHLKVELYKQELHQIACISGLSITETVTITENLAFSTNAAVKSGLLQEFVYFRFVDENVLAALVLATTAQV